MKHPPYARLLVDRTRDPRNRQCSWWVLIGAVGWKKAQSWKRDPRRIFCLCPPGEDPARFNWSIYRDAPPPIGLVRCGSVDGHQLRQLAKALLAAGSPRIYDVLGDTVFHRQSKRAAA